MNTETLQNSRTHPPLILVIEDEKHIRHFIRSTLEEEGFRVHEAGQMNQGLIDAATRKPELILLDLGLPDGDGLDFVRDLRTWSGVPVLVLSARSTEVDKVGVLDAGADDYLTKPFSIVELLARIRALLRRSQAKAMGEESAEISFDGVQIDFARRRVSKDGEALRLTPIEYRLLAILVANSGKVMTHRHLLREIWGPTFTENSHYLRIYVSHLRQKLEQDATQPRHLLTETGVGYRFQL